MVEPKPAPEPASLLVTLTLRTNCEGLRALLYDHGPQRLRRPAEEVVELLDLHVESNFDREEPAPSEAEEVAS